MISRAAADVFHQHPVSPYHDPWLPTCLRADMSRGPKSRYPFATMKPGDVVTVTSGTTHFQRYVSHYGFTHNKKFSTLCVAPDTYEVRRVDGLPDVDKLLRSRSRSSKLTHVRNGTARGVK